MLSHCTGSYENLKSPYPFSLNTTRSKPILIQAMQANGIRDV